MARAKRIKLDESIKRAMARGVRLAGADRAPVAAPIYEHSVPADDTRGLDPRRFDVRIVVMRRGHRPMTAADVAAAEAAFPAHSPRKAVARRAAARTGRRQP